MKVGMGVKYHPSMRFTRVLAKGYDEVRRFVQQSEGQAYASTVLYPSAFDTSRFLLPTVFVPACGDGQPNRIWPAGFTDLAQ